MSVPRLRDYQGFALLSYGFRPFFLFGSIYAGAMIPLWLACSRANLSFPPPSRRATGMSTKCCSAIVAAVLGGFLLTAVPNWTGRLPLQGAPLAVLVSAWLAGPHRGLRVGRRSDGRLPAPSMLPFWRCLRPRRRARSSPDESGAICRSSRSSRCLAPTMSRSISRRMLSGLAEYSTRFAVALVITLVSLIGGRIVPSFTRNWLARQQPGRMPSPFGRLDAHHRRRERDSRWWHGSWPRRRKSPAAC